MPSSFAALSSASPIKYACSGKGAEIRLAGVTDTRLLTMGMPYSPERSEATFTMFFAFWQTVS